MVALIPIWSQWTVFLGFISCTCFSLLSSYEHGMLSKIIFSPILQRQNTIVRSPLLQPYPQLCYLIIYMQYTENPIAKICQLISLPGYFIIRFESIHFTHDIKFQTIIVCHTIICCFCDVWVCNREVTRGPRAMVPQF